MPFNHVEAGRLAAARFQQQPAQKTPVSPKYTAAEIERRWLVELEVAESLAHLPVRHIEDRYLRGTRLRLRKVLDGSGVVTYKLGKKYGKSTPLSEPVVSVYLSQAEYEVLSVHGGSVASKARYAVHGGALDVYSSPRLGFAVFEVEFGSAEDASAYVPPSFTGEEVTNNEKYSGLALAVDAG